MSATGKSPRQAETGFTLIEALVTLAVAALVAGIVFPSLQSAMARSGFAATTNAVVLALREARADAMLRDAHVVLTLDPDRRTLLRDGAPAFALPDGVGLSLPPRGLSFYADGTAGGGEAVLTSAGRTRRLTVDALSGGGKALW